MFSDIANHWARQCIVALAQREIVSGYPQGTFRPLSTVTRAEFASLMPKVFPELSEQGSPQTFQDVPPEYWAHEAIAWATQHGLFGGYENGTFRPKQAISRLQALVVLMKGLEATQGVAVNILDEPDSPAAIAASERTLIAQYFSDADQVPNYGRSAIAGALKRQLLEQIDQPRRLRPNQPVTRGEIASLLCRALDIPTAELVDSYPALEAAQNTQLVFDRMLQAEAGFDQSKLAFLDLGAFKSPYRKDINQFALWLQQPEDMASSLKPAGKSGSAASADTAVYPATGELFFVNESGLAFLPAGILSACVCLSTVQEGKLQGRWLGRDALSDRQMWSSTKFIPLLNVAARANQAIPSLDLSQCRVRAAGSTGRSSGYSFQDLASGIMTYDNRIASSNSLAVMFKNFETPERLEKWTRQMTGNQSLSFQGRYGEVPFIQYPELWSSQFNRVVLKSSRVGHQGENLMSTYDLTRLLSMAAWHWQLPAESRIPDLQTLGLASIIKAMAMDTARYIDVAIETLGLTEWVRSPVVISKSGFGRSDSRDHTELTYCALAQFSLPRSITMKGAPDPTAAYQRHSLCLTLIAAQNVGDANAEARYVDALMATAVTEIIRRTVLGIL